MKQPTNVQERIQRFFEKKAIAIPLRTIRFFFMLYLIISALAFTIIIIYPRDFLRDSFPRNSLLSPDSLRKFSKHLK
jgi:hypothetical protein